MLLMDLGSGRSISLNLMHVKGLLRKARLPLLENEQRTFKGPRWLRSGWRALLYIYMTSDVSFHTKVQKIHCIESDVILTADLLCKARLQLFENARRIC